MMKRIVWSVSKFILRMESVDSLGLLRRPGLFFLIFKYGFLNVQIV